MNVMDLADRSWPVLRRLMGAHATVYRATRGVVGHRFPGVPPMLLLDHTGARSGRRRTTPLLYVRDGQNLGIIASKGGYPKHPAWYHNLRAHPDTTVQVGAQRLRVRARTAAGEERERVWAEAVRVYPTYTDYQRRTQREIPVVVLEPRP